MSIIKRLDNLAEWLAVRSGRGRDVYYFETDDDHPGMIFYNDMWMTEAAFYELLPDDNPDDERIQFIEINRTGGGNPWQG